MMKKSMLLLVSALLVSYSARADVVTVSQAERTARQFVNKNASRLNAAAGGDLKLAHQAISKGGTPDYYVFNRGDQGGFVVVSGDDRLQPVCGYCDHGTFDLEKLPSNVKWWFGEYQRQVQYLRDHPQVKVRKKVTLSSSVGPLLTTKWDQRKPFNDMCPVSPNEDDTYWIYGNRACAGCVAISLSQIMNFYQWPEQGIGSKTYTFDLDGEVSTTLSADFSQSFYQWDLMKDEYLYMDKNNYGYFDDNMHVYIKVIDENGDTITDPNGIHSNAVAKLISDVGIACEMGYGSAGSGAYTYYAYYALWDYFKYFVVYANRDNYQGEWDEDLREELDMNRPMYYAGQASGGHAFVIDGYDNQGLFHVNWGWGGWYDGYYESLALNPGGEDGYNSNQEVMVFYPYHPLTSSPASGESIDFGRTTIGNAVTRTVTVTGLYIDENQDIQVSIIGDDAAQFRTVSTLSSASANQDGGVTFEVYYEPSTGGQHAAQLVIEAGNDYAGNKIEPIIIYLNGNTGIYFDANDDGVIDVDDVTRAISACLNGEVLNYLGRIPDVSDVSELIARVIGD